MSEGQYTLVLCTLYFPAEPSGVVFEGERGTLVVTLRDVRVLPTLQRSGAEGPSAPPPTVPFQDRGKKPFKLSCRQLR